MNLLRDLLGRADPHLGWERVLRGCWAQADAQGGGQALQQKIQLFSRLIAEMPAATGAGMLVQLNVQLETDARLRRSRPFLQRAQLDGSAHMLW